MKIFYSHDIFSEQEYGGVSRYFVEIIERLNEYNPDIHVISGLYFNKYLSRLNSSCKVSGIKIKNNFFANKLILRSLNEAYQSFVLRNEKEGVFHQTYYSPVPIRRNFNVVVTVHDMVHELFPDMFSSINATTYAKKVSCERADKIIAVSESTKKDLINIFDIDPQKVEVIYHGTDFCNQFKEIESHKHSAPYILFVGSRKLYKNFDKVLKVLNLSPEISKNFDLICFGGGQFTKKEIEQIRDYKLENVVHHRSGLDSVLAQYYSGARALVYPSFYEGFGIPILEAMSMGCPVICSNQSSLPEVAQDSAIYFNPSDMEHLKYTLEKVLFDEQTLSEFTHRGLARHKLFTWENTAQKTFEVYKKTFENLM